MIEIFAALGDGVWQALQPVNLALAFIGVVVGLFVGAMPGLGSIYSAQERPNVRVK